MMGKFVEFGRSSVTIEQEMLNATNGELHATSQYVLVFCDSKTRQSTTIPENCQQAMLAAGARQKN